MKDSCRRSATQDIGPIAEHLGRPQREGRDFRANCPVCGRHTCWLRPGCDGGFICGCWLGCDWKDIKAEIRRLGFDDGYEHERASRAPPRPTSSSAPNNGWWQDLWRQTLAIEGTSAERYLERRALPPPYGARLRFHPSAKSKNQGQKPRPPAPALVGLIERFDLERGCFVAIGVTCAFVTADGGKRFPGDNRRFYGPRKGGGVWLVLDAKTSAERDAVLAGTEGELVIGEGVESVLSAMKLWGSRSGVAALCASGIETLVLPPSVRLVRIAADNDANEAGQDAAAMAWARWRREGREVRVTLPTRPDGAESFDFNDILLSTGEAS
jgi:putative DNA primase/helicase